MPLMVHFRRKLQVEKLHKETQTRFFLDPVMATSPHKPCLLNITFFQQLILILKGVLAYAIPNTPYNLQTQLSRELHLRQEHLYELKQRSDFEPRLSFAAKANTVVTDHDDEDDDDERFGVSLERQVFKAFQKSHLILEQPIF